MVLFFVAIYGLLFGSFFNVVIYRLPNKMSLANPPSHCTSCNNKLKAIDLVPVFSWLFLKGKCRYCGEKISIRYTLVELLTAGLWVLMYFRFGFTPDLIASIVLISIMINVIFIDMEHNIIPDELVIFGILMGVIAAIVSGFTDMKLTIYGDTAWWNPIVGSMSGSVILAIIAIVGEKVYGTDDAMGFGDVKIFIPIGLFLGWKMTLLALVASIIIGAVIGVTLMIYKVVDRKGGMPFGPSIAIGVLLTYLFGQQLLNWYLNFM